MPRQTNQKLKILYLLQILYEKTDPEHGIELKEIMSSLANYDISAERKSLYSDFEALENFGIEIIKEVKGNSHTYALGTRAFELPELKLLVDIVQSAKFITKKKSDELIKKIEQFSSRYETKDLQRNVYVADRVKTGNENIYYNIDGIHQAISSGKQIEFTYLEWNTKGELVPKKNGEKYIVSPGYLTFDDENYYLIANDEKENKVKYYRVDKMKSINVLDVRKNEPLELKKFDLAVFSKKTFGMFDGETKKVTLLVDNKMIGVIFDRFGTDIPLIKVDDSHMKVIVSVSVSRQFFGWIMSLGEGVKIIAPDSVVEDMKKEIKRLSEMY